MPHIPMLRETNVRQGFFTREEIDPLASFLPDGLGGMAMFGFLTGWRFDEIQGLEWRNVDFTAGEVRLFRSKNEDGRVFPFTEEIRSILEAQLGQSGRFAKVFPQEAFRK